jgi:hypothetical protein
VASNIRPRVSLIIFPSAFHLPESVRPSTQRASPSQTDMPSRIRVKWLESLFPCTADKLDRSRYLEKTHASVLHYTYPVVSRCLSRWFKKGCLVWNVCGGSRGGYCAIAYTRVGIHGNFYWACDNIARWTDALSPHHLVRLL